MDDRRLDDAIDRAVREIMGVEPRPGLRGRVLERVNRPGRPALPWLRVAATAGAIAAVLLIVTLTQREPEQPRAPIVAVAPRATPQQSGTTIPPRSANPPTVPTPRLTRPAVAPPIESRRVEAAMLEPGEPFEPSVQVPPIEPIEPIEVAELTTKPIVPTEITVPAIRIDRIEIEPLSPPR